MLSEHQLYIHGLHNFALQNIFLNLLGDYYGVKSGLKIKDQIARGKKGPVTLSSPPLIFPICYAREEVYVKFENRKPL